MEWWLGYAGIGAAVGFFAGMLGIGGAAITVPFMLLCNVPIWPRECWSSCGGNWPPGVWRRQRFAVLRWTAGPP